MLTIAFINMKAILVKNCYVSRPNVENRFRQCGYGKRTSHVDCHADQRFQHFDHLPKNPKLSQIPAYLFQ